MNSNESPWLRYRFGDLVMDVGRRRVSRRGEAIHLSKLTFGLLRVLVERAPNVVGHDECAAGAWGPRRIVTPENLAQRVMTLRQALGDSSVQPRYIEGVRGEGYRLIPEVVVVAIEPDHPAVPAENLTPSAASASRGRRRRTWLASAVLGPLTISATTYWLTSASTNPDAEIAPGGVTPSEVLPNSVAILPCDNLSTAAEHSFFAPAIHLEIVDRLANVSSLEVFSPASVARFKQVPFAHVARELPVESIVTCSVLYAGTELRIVAQVADARSGKVHWSKPYGGSSQDLVSIQKALATDLVTALVMNITPTDLAAIENAHTQSPEAHALFLQARVSAPAASIQLLDRALAIDPSFAAAHGLKAQTCALNVVNNGGLWRIGARRDLRRSAVESSNTAIGLDAEQSWAWNARTLAYLYSWRWSEARTAYENLRRMRPNDPFAAVGYSWFLAFVGDHENAKRFALERLERDRGANAYYSLGRVLVWGGDGDGAIQAHREALRLAPSSAGAFSGIGQAEVQRGRFVEAAAAFRTAEELIEQQDDPPSVLLPELIWGYGAAGLNDDARRLFGTFERWATEYEMGAGDWALASLGVGDYEAALAWLERAVAKVEAREVELGFYSLMTIKTNPFRDPMLERPPFGEFRSRLGTLD